MTQAALFDAGAIETDASGLDSLATPPEILALVDRFWLDGYDLDPATNRHALTKPRVGWTIADDCFTQPTWAIAGPGTRIWMNPPYSDPRRFVRWLALAHWDDACECMTLLRNDYSTQWFADCVETATAWAALRDRPKFWTNGAPTAGGTVAASMFYWGENAGRWRGIFEEIGWTFPAKWKRPFWRRA